jgi:ATP adenylyltransferase/5',5'''-P-1,P-4-tetraphosphate phosphorylase II
MKEAEDSSFRARLNALIEHQRSTWPALADGYDRLAHIETKRIRIAETDAVVQHNPRRIKSTAASIDRASVEARRCFLCEENLPAEEKGLAYGDDLVLLCNPFPVLDKHISVVHREHVEQRLDRHIETMLGLAADLAPDYFVLYNGPECGASAPDHLHFQACSRRLLPIEEAIRQEDSAVEDCDACLESARGGFELFTLSGVGRTVIVMRGGSDAEISEWGARVLEDLARATDKREAMVNLICTYDRGVWTLYIFPRSRHRPAAFFAEGEDRLTISPGAIDMAGVIVVPERDHFDRLTGELMEGIFAEVSYGEEAVNDLLERISTAGQEAL